MRGTPYVCHEDSGIPDERDPRFTSSLSTRSWLRMGSRIPAVEQTLKRMLAHRDDRVLLAQVALASRWIAGRRSVPALILMLEWEDAEDRRQAAVLLGELGDAKAVGPICARLEQDPDWRVRTQCCVALARIGRPEAIPWLERARKSSERFGLGAHADELANGCIARSASAALRQIRLRSDETEGGLPD